MEYKIAILIFIVLYVENFAKPRNENLLSVVVIYRHGSRNPLMVYKNDPYAARVHELWPEGLEQLNEEGIRQHHLLGGWLRNRYKHFLRPQYHEEDISVLSSNADRCLLSACANLAGLYPPPPRGQWDQVRATWSPVPIHTEQPNQTSVLSCKKYCAKFDRLYSELWKSKAFVDHSREQKELIDYANEHSGETRTDSWALVGMNDALEQQSLKNLTLPVWTKKIYPGRLEAFINFFWTVNTYTKEMARLYVGPVIEIIANHLEATSERTPKTFKFLMLSTHENTLVSLLISLGIYDMQPPKHASTIIFELRQGTANQYVNIFYKNATYSDAAHPMTPPGCDPDCDLQRFKKIVAPLRIDPGSWERECFGKDRSV